MCLTVDPKKTKKLLKSKKKEFIFYKVFEKKDGKLFSLFQHAKVYCVNKLPEFKKNVFDVLPLEGGVFHAHLTKKESYLHYCIFFDAITILPIHVKKEHIVAVGIDEDVCFTQYEIKKRTYKQALETDKFTS